MSIGTFEWEINKWKSHQHCIMFTEPWCKYCVEYKPTFEEIASRYPNIKFYYSGIENEAMGYFDFNTIPHIVLYDGIEYKSFHRDELEERLKQL